MANFNNQFATQKLRQEMSVTGTGATFTPGTGEQMATNKAFKKKVKKEEKDVEPKLAAGKAKVYAKDKWGWKDAPSIPNRPSKGGFIYKQLFEDTLEERSINEALEVGDRVKVVYGSEFYGETGTIDDIIRGFVTVEMDRDGRVYSMHSSDVERIEDEDDDSDFVKESELNIKNIGDFNYRMNTLGLAAQQMRDEQLFNMLAKLRSQKDITSAIDILDDVKSKIETHKTLNKSIKIDALKAIDNIKRGYETINEAIDKVHIGTDKKTDSNIYFEPSTGTFSINVIDGLGNRWNKLQVNTIDDVIAKFPAWSWTEKGIQMFPEFEPEGQDDVLDEAYIPDNIKRFAQKKGITSIVNQVARWAEKAGKRIVGGTAIGKNYSTLILDLTYQGSEVYINTDNDIIEVNGIEVEDYKSFASALNTEETENDYWTNKTVKIVKGTYAGNTGEVIGAGNGQVDVAVGPQRKVITVNQDEVKIVDELNESYSRFKNETKTRGKADQFHQAVRQVRQKVQEINRLFEYVSRLKSELSEGEGGLKYKVHTEKALAKIKEMVAELNQNIKKFK